MSISGDGEGGTLTLGLPWPRVTAGDQPEPPPPVVPNTCARTESHLRAARALLLGPKPAPDPGPGDRLVAALGGMADVATFEVLKQLTTAAHRQNLDGASYHGLAGGWLEQSEAAVEDPAPYFPVPVAPVVKAARVRDLPGGALEDLCFESRYAPHRPAARQTLRQFRSSNG